MSIELQPILLSFGGLLLAGIVHGASGFGFGLVAIGLSGLALGDAKMGTVLPIFSNVVLTAFLLNKYWRYVPWNRMAPFLIASACGVPVGVWLLVNLSIVWVNVALATLLIASGIRGLTARKQGKRWHRVWVGVPLGFMAGGLGGAFNTGGPAAIPYVASQNLSRFAFVAGLQANFFMSCVLRLTCLTQSGLVTRDIVVVGMLGIAVAISGGLIGNRILHRVSDKQLRLYTYGFLIALGLLYTARAWASWPRP